MEENVFISSFKWVMCHCAEKREGKEEKIDLIVTNNINWKVTNVMVLYYCYPHIQTIRLLILNKNYIGEIFYYRIFKN